MNKKYAFALVAVIILGGLYHFSGRTVVNDGTVSTPTVSIKSVVSEGGVAATISSSSKTIIWETNNYPESVGVNINLLRKVSDSPRQFVAVRTIATDTPNDGQESWTPRAGENTGDLYVEVTCSVTYEFDAGCKLGGDVVKVN